ncbi:MAG: SMR family transporter [Alphaproteobacteria bacterium]|nr:SMR family transporter [Alphaproteobacteria bacterium]
MLLTYCYLSIAIISEVIATLALKPANGFTEFIPSMICVLGYAIAFYFLSLTLRNMPIGIVYAIWSGAGVVLITGLGWVWFKQVLDVPAIIGCAMIVAGVAVINLYSQSLIE